ncbi:hypothetical protein CEW88_23460 (plasmid) [Alloyangia pacifica]|uniref:Uncharacterized protein n=1 Tax=Alloyangia pacifica TaxID=311180 RepID=A0A2U8HP40_9RHOB|nr:MATE family efflux transporter [Alloyangia pacifica]AWI86726.1 hypothetical protein CEW88_23460 [Alloyangia pacifica]
MNLRRNSIFAATEVVVYGLGLFFIYRNVVQVLGVEMLGVWSLVLATTAFGRVADVGIAGGLGRYIARSLGAGRPDKAIMYMRTGILSISALMGAIALLLWYPLWRALAIALEGEELAIARDILPWAIFSFWLLNLKAVMDACLLGVHRADLRAVANIAGMLLQVWASLALVNDYELHGLAWAQAAQFFLAIGLSVVFLLTVARVNTEGSPIRSWFSYEQFREMLGFGVKLQIGTIANLLFEPGVKIVLGAIAGTAMLGIFEMAYRFVYQVRNVAIRAIQTTVPSFADYDARDNDDIVDLFSKVSRTAAIATATLMPAVIIGSPLVSWLWLSEVNYLFIFITALIAVMWGIGILASPAFFLGIGIGRVAPNVVGQIMAGILAPAFVYLICTVATPDWAVLGVVLGRLPGDLLPAVLTRPRGHWHHAAILNPYNLAALVIVVVFSVVAAWIAFARIT